MPEENAARDPLAQHLLDDATDRVRYQHEFSQAGFRTLILINGGAIIALLTYAGNVLDRGGAVSLRVAFVCYVVGLAATTLAYVFAYFSQGLILDAVSTHAYARLGLYADPTPETARAAKKEKWGFRLILCCVALSVIGLGGFLAGSMAAMSALT